MFFVTALVLHPLINGHAQLLLSAMSAGKVVLLLLPMSYSVHSVKFVLNGLVV